jgi:hypothetical protein
LQILGLYTSRDSASDYPKYILKTLKDLRNARLSLPFIHILEYDGNYFLDPVNVSIFPAFYSVEHHATIPRVLLQSFPRATGKKILLKFSIYLIDSSNMSSIYELAKDVAANFPQISWLHLWFEHQCEIVSFFKN